MKGYVIVSEEARDYKSWVKDIALFYKRPILNGRLAICIDVYPPDKRARDLDNLLKITLDSLESAKFFENDSQIDKIIMERKEREKGGKITVTIKEITENDSNWVDSLFPKID